MLHHQFASSFHRCASVLGHYVTLCLRLLPVRKCARPKHRLSSPTVITNCHHTNFHQLASVLVCLATAQTHPLSSQDSSDSNKIQSMKIMSTMTIHCDLGSSDQQFLNPPQCVPNIPLSVSCTTRSKPLYSCLQMRSLFKSCKSAIASAKAPNCKQLVFLQVASLNDWINANKWSSPYNYGLGARQAECQQAVNSWFTWIAMGSHGLQSARMSASGSHVHGLLELQWDHMVYNQPG
eukprot:scaffold33440_cov18-Tisochrysis_lutea.AAC.1